MTIGVCTCGRRTCGARVDNLAPSSLSSARANDCFLGYYVSNAMRGFLLLY